MHVPDRIQRLCRRARAGGWASERLGAALRGALAPLDEVERAAALRHTYWHGWDVPTDVLADLAGGAAALRAVAGRGPVVGCCRDCGRVVRAAHRDEVGAADRPVRCPTCHTRPAGRRTAPRHPPRPPTSWELEAPPRPHAVRPAADLAAGRRLWGEDYRRPLAARPDLDA